MTTIPAPTPPRRAPVSCGASLDHLAVAAELLQGTGSGHSHPRAAALLLRRALEDRLAGYVAAHEPAMARCRAETKAVWLAHQLSPELAGRFSSLWHSLSGACHYHQSTLPPTLAELRSWHADATFVLRAVPPPPPAWGTAPPAVSSG